MNNLDTVNSNINTATLEKYSSIKNRVFHPKSDFPLSQKVLISLKKNKYKITNKYDLQKLTKSIINEPVIQITPLNVKSSYHTIYYLKSKKLEYILKINSLNNLFTDYSFFIEEYIQKILLRSKLPNIKVFNIDITRDYIPTEFMLMEFLRDSPLEQFKNSEYKNIYTDLGRVFKQIHSISANNYGPIDIKLLLTKNELTGTFSSWKSFIFLNLNNHLKECVKIGVLSPSELVSLKSIYVKSKPIFTNSKSSLIHNDPSLRNIFVNNNRVTGIIDWEDAIFGDPLWEIAFIDTFLFRKEDKLKFKLFCNGYGININKEYKSLKYWLYYLRISLLKTISRFKFGYENDMGLKIDKLRVKRAIRNIDKIYNNINKD